jgi:hypothetical protein
MSSPDDWPALPYDSWKDTYTTVHLWTQIAGKIRLAQTPWINHSWSVALYVTSRGLTTSPIPHSTRPFQIDFDFVEHALEIRADRSPIRRIALEPRPVADFYSEVMRTLEGMELAVDVSPMPCEIEGAIPLSEDRTHRAYDPDAAHRFFQALSRTHGLLQEFRAHFLGKASPVHFFWGSFDLAATRFSGRPAPPHPGGSPHLPDWVAREAYSHEVSSCGFWPGGGTLPYPLFYSYAYPEPEGFRAARIAPRDAFYDAEFGEFILPYDRVRESSAPDETLTSFFQSTYAAAADLARWDRAVLERETLPPPFPPAP